MDEKCPFTILDLSIYFAEGVNYEEIDAKDPDTLTEVEKVALLGRPCLGDITKIQIRIRENKEFKVSQSAEAWTPRVENLSFVLFFSIRTPQLAYFQAAGVRGRA